MLFRSGGPPTDMRRRHPKNCPTVTPIVGQAATWASRCRQSASTESRHSPERLACPFNARLRHQYLVMKVISSRAGKSPPQGNRVGSSASLFPFGAPDDVPPCMRHRLFIIIGDWNKLPRLVRARQRVARCIGNCMGLFLDCDGDHPQR